MRCIELSESFGLDHLHLVERPKPEPCPGEVRVKMRAVSLNYRDLMMVNGVYNPRQKLPLIPASDGVGIIDAVGVGVKIAVGTRVAGCFAPDWLDGEPTREKLRNTLGGPKDGMLAEFVVAAESAVITVPDHLTDAQAATLPCAAVTAWNAVVELGHVKAGETVLVQGTGGVSLFALQFAHMHGARVIVTSSSDEKLAKAKALGASETLNYARDKDWGKSAKALTDGGVDLVIEVGGAGTIAHSLKAVRIGGSIMMIGVLAGVSTELSLTQILMQAVRVQGQMVGSKAHFAAMNRAIALHGLEPVIHASYALEDAPKALAALSRGSHFGKLVVTFD